MERIRMTRTSSSALGQYLEGKEYTVSTETADLFEEADACVRLDAPKSKPRLVKDTTPPADDDDEADDAETADDQAVDDEAETADADEAEAAETAEKRPRRRRRTRGS